MQQPKKREEERGEWITGKTYRIADQRESASDSSDLLHKTRYMSSGIARCRIGKRNSVMKMDKAAESARTTPMVSVCTRYQLAVLSPAALQSAPKDAHWKLQPAQIFPRERK